MVLDKIAESCFLQGNYHLATKKWTQVLKNPFEVKNNVEIKNKHMYI